jgi:predicted DNA binding CopG/RHH family protein
MDKIYTKEELKKLLAESKGRIVEGSAFFTDEFGNVINIDEAIEQAEKDIEKKYPKVNFRWSEFEIARAKKIAKALGMPYQTYIKSLIKQGMDNDEKRLMQG